MSFAVTLMFLPAVIALAAGIPITIFAARALPRTQSGTPRHRAAVFRLIAGIGAIVGAVLCAVAPFADVPYAIVLFPFLAILLVVLWVIGWMVAAAIEEGRASRS